MGCFSLFPQWWDLDSVSITVPSSEACAGLRLAQTGAALRAVESLALGSFLWSRNPSSGALSRVALAPSPGLVAFPLSLGRWEKQVGGRASR